MIQLPTTVILAITDLGESSVLIATSLLLTGWFWASGQRTMAVAWLATVGGCAASMMALKLGFLTCGHLLPALAIHSPSGHSAMAEVFYGVAAVTLGTAWQAGERVRALAVLLALAVAVAVALTRLALNAHSPPEVIAGLLVGAAWLACFVWLKRQAPLAAIPRPVLMLALLVLYGGVTATLLSGRHLATEGLLAQVAQLLNQHHVCMAV